MCILSIFSKQNGDFILTHNRDESIYRQTSPNVQQNQFHGQMVIGPVDLNSGGTWIYHTQNYVVCVLNGAYEKHEHRPPYKMSRGLVILELLKYKSIEEFISLIDLNEIEPFTMVMIDIKNQEKQILVWDGTQKFTEDKSTEPLIVRSSSTLYEESEKVFHRNAFENLQKVEPESIYELHTRLSMPKNEKFPIVQSTSITQVVHSVQTIDLKFCPILIAN